eukprot:gnl/TRDRNA2_/TRDRNA2_35186_c0_seq1.p1 gnl/TRDRNA2_/TRDRNA2_35186_c0~~gnl/TRDRNA2_/TRDRNA2_35186_c0_seq1.p1  ORF type:complete len:809 (-),score=177.71 gnl/TRDRNA2_/TRDRNA2_35186_c0_seq1:308-2734(-)
MISTTLGTCGAGLTLSYVVYKSARPLGEDEQLRVQKLGKVEVHNGPGFKFLLPFTYRTAEVVKATTLGALEYVKVTDTLAGSERVETGPKLLFLGSYEKASAKAEGISLSGTDYVLIEDKLSGEKKVKRGPCVWFPEPQEKGEKASGMSLSSTEYVLVTDKQSGQRSVVKGPCVWFPEPMQDGKKGAGISLGSTDYVIVEDRVTGEKHVEQGPCVWFPGPQEDGKKGSGLSLGDTEYVLVEDKRTGKKCIKTGPCVWIPGPHEDGKRGEAVSLGSTEFIIVEDKLTGKKETVQGPKVWFPNPYDVCGEVCEAVALQEDEYVRLKDMATGERWVQQGKALVFLQPTWKIEISVQGAKPPPGREGKGIRKAFVLKKNEYVRLIDNVKGTIRCEHGESTVFPGPDEQPLEQDGGKLTALDLKVNEYVKVLNQATGEIRVVAGAGTGKGQVSQQVFLGPLEKWLDGGKQKAVTVDDENAVLVRNKKSGQLTLVTEKQLFVPGPHESIEDVRKLIRLAEHEAMIIKDKDGQFDYYFGSETKRTEDQKPAFFLPAYAEIVKLNWSRGRRREKRDLWIERFDCRAQYMSFEFNCRTKDNVELVLEGTFFWEVVDLALMVRTTGDTSGDICNHARSQFIKHVAKVSLEEFMNDLSLISDKVYQDDSKFYESRGVKVHSLEVTGYQCADASTSQILQQIIQETTNRMNRLSKQESENEVRLFDMQGRIEMEKRNGELLIVQHEHAEAEAKVAGISEAQRVQAFISGLAETVPDLQDRMKMWQTLRKTEALNVLSQGGANLYFTPNDVNLSIETAPQA